MQLSQNHYLDQVYDSDEESDDNWKEFRKEAQDELEYTLQEGRESGGNEADGHLQDDSLARNEDAQDSGKDE